MDEIAILKPMLARARIDSLNPESAHVAFQDFPVRVLLPYRDESKFQVNANTKAGTVRSKNATFGTNLSTTGKMVPEILGGCT
jgi:hypothetical protein